MEQQRITINISGKIFVTTEETLCRLPDTKLGKLVSNHVQSEQHFFDADEEAFREVLRYHRTGELHVPRNMCHKSFSRELEFWGVKGVDIQDCCQRAEDNRELEKHFHWFERRHELDREPTLKEKVWYFLTDPTGPYTTHKRAAIAFALLYTLIIVGQALINAAATLPCQAQRYLLNMDTNDTLSYMQTISDHVTDDTCNRTGTIMENMRKDPSIWVLEYVFSAFFITEIVVRFICCSQKKQFFCSIHSVDLVIATAELIQYLLFVANYILINYVHAYGTDTNMCTIFTVLHMVMVYIVHMRAFRILYFATVFSELQVLLLAIYKSRKEIALLVTALGVSCLICGPLIFYMEMIGTLITKDEHTNIDSVPTGYWWVIVTMTTVGYGDYYPKTGVGYVAAAIVMTLGIMITALPIAIIGTNFSLYYEYHRKRVQQKRKQQKLLERQTKTEMTEISKIVNDDSRNNSVHEK